jgi:hypothetical protein
VIEVECEGLEEGCNYRQLTQKAAGFQIEEVERQRAGWVELVAARKPA